MSQTMLKMLALVCMTLDHIAAFIPGAPQWLRIIGRIAAPLFLFCSVDGFRKTHDRRKMLQRLYIMSVLMALANTVINTAFFNSELHIDNNFFQTIFCVLFVIQLKERGRKLLPYFLISLAAAILIITNVETALYPDAFSALLSAILCNPFLTEGGFLYFALGIAMYHLAQSKRKLAVSILLLCLFQFLNAYFDLCYRAISVFTYLLGGNIDAYMLCYLGERISGITMLPSEFSVWKFHSWMSCLALPFMLNYNGTRGKGWQKFFYAYYPLHIYIIAGIAYFIIS